MIHGPRAAGAARNARIADLAMITQQLLRLIQQLAFMLQTGAAIAPPQLLQTSVVSVDSLFYPFRPR